MKVKSTAITLIILSFVLTTSAQQLLTANFNFTGELTNYGWRRIPDLNNAAIKTDSPGLNYTGYVLSGIGNTAKLDSTGQDLEMGFSAFFYQNNITYTSFMLNVKKATTIGDYFFSNTTTNPSGEKKAKVFIKLASTGFYKIGIAKANETPIYGNDSFAVNVTSLVVLKYETIAGNNNDLVSIFNLKSGFPASEPTPLVQINSGTDTDMWRISGIALFQGTDSIAPKLLIDGIRSANNWIELNKPTKEYQLGQFKHSEVTINSAKLTWEKFKNNYYDSIHTTLVFIKENNYINLGSPSINDNLYTANPNFLTANSFYENDVNAKCILNSDSTNVVVTGLKQKTVYHAIIYSYDKINNTYSQLWQTNFTTLTTAPKPLVNLNFVATSKTTAKVSWYKPLDYSNTQHTIVVFAKESNAITILGKPNKSPSSILSNLNFSAVSSSFQFDIAAKCVYKGDGSEVDITNLEPGKEYYIVAYTINDLDSNYSDIATTSDFTNNDGPASVTATKWNAFNNSISEISWEKSSSYNNNDYTTVVYLKQGNAIHLGLPNLNPNNITANNIFGNGAAFQNDSLAFCVYKGDLSKCRITNLIANTNYYAVVYVINNNDSSYSNPRVVIGITKDVPPSNVSNVNVVGLSNSTLKITWTKPIDYNNDNYSTIVYVKQNNPINAEITNRDVMRNTLVSVSMINNKASQFPSDSNARCVFLGDSNFVTLYGVNNYTNYHVLVFVVRNQDSTYSLNGVTGVGTASPNLPTPNFYFINQINKINLITGVPDSNNVRVALRGLVYQNNQINPFPTGIQFVINDNTGGINIYSNTSNFYYEPKIGDSVLVFGKIISRNGLLSLQVDSIGLIGQFKKIKLPFVTNQLNEITENELVEIKRLRLLNTFNPYWERNYTYEVINDSNQVFNIRIEEKNNLVGNPLPKNKYFNLIGIGAQKSSANAPFPFTGYYISPRNIDDIQIFEPLSPFGVINPNSYSNLAINGDTNQTITIKWTKSTPYSLISNPIYALQLDSLNGQFLNTNALIPASNNGLDTSLTITYGQIGRALTALGLSNGQSKTMRWRILAKSGVYNQNSDTVITTFTLGYPTSFLAIKAEKLVVYPNPVGNKLTIQLPENIGKSVQIEMIDLTGKVIMNQTSNTLGLKEVAINTMPIAKGIYLVKLIGLNQVFLTKIVKE